MNIGDTVICVNAAPNSVKTKGRRVPQGSVKEGESYTITGIAPDGDLFITCKNVVNRVGQNIAWRRDRFRLMTDAEKTLATQPISEDWD